MVVSCPLSSPQVVLAEFDCFPSSSSPLDAVSGSSSNTHSDSISRPSMDFRLPQRYSSRTSSSFMRGSDQAQKGNLAGSCINSDAGRKLELENPDPVEDPFSRRLNGLLLVIAEEQFSIERQGY